MRTSPPTHSDGLRKTISVVRHVPLPSVLLGSGTSSLMYLAFPHLVQKGDRVVLLDPMYGEYRHIFQNVLGCQVIAHELGMAGGFAPDLTVLAEQCQGASLLVMVNPNSPTGYGIGREDMAKLLQAVPSTCRVWIDETYIDFAPKGWSAEPLVSQDPRLVVCKSMSKFYGLSGLRIGYLVADPAVVRALEPLSPPWSVGLIAQVAGVEALLDADYYEKRSYETASLREQLAQGLAALPVHVYPSVTNFLLFRLGAGGAQAVVDRCRQNGVHLRNCDSLSPRFRDDHIRTAVKDAATNGRILESISRALT